jgi:DNA-binding GntR family transcriptional regulator
VENSLALKVAVAEAAPVRKLVADNIRNAIISGRFAPGARLKEHELVSWTGVSRTAVREALRQLEAEGVVDNIPNKGPVVATVTPEEARCHYEVRAALESLLAKAAAENVTKADATKLKQFSTDLRKSFERGSIEQMLKVKNELDEYLLSMSHNTLLVGFLQLIHARLAYLRPLVLQQGDRLHENVDEISAMIDAIVAGDAKKAAKAALVHVQRGGEATLALLNSQAQESRAK